MVTYLLTGMSLERAGIDGWNGNIEVLIAACIYCAATQRI
jgi:hypothetical protein